MTVRLATRVPTGDVSVMNLSTRQKQGTLYVGFDAPNLALCKTCAMCTAEHGNGPSNQLCVCVHSHSDKPRARGAPLHTVGGDSTCLKGVKYAWTKNAFCLGPLNEAHGWWHVSTNGHNQSSLTTEYHDHHRHSNFNNKPQGGGSMPIHRVYFALGGSTEIPLVGEHS